MEKNTHRNRIGRFITSNDDDDHDEEVREKQAPFCLNASSIIRRNVLHSGTSNYLKKARDVALLEPRSRRQGIQHPFMADPNIVAFDLKLV